MICCSSRTVPCPSTTRDLFASTTFPGAFIVDGVFTFNFRRLQPAQAVRTFFLLGLALSGGWLDESSVDGLSGLAWSGLTMACSHHTGEAQSLRTHGRSARATDLRRPRRLRRISPLRRFRLFPLSQGQVEALCCLSRGAIIAEPNRPCDRPRSFFNDTWTTSEWRDIFCLSAASAAGVFDASPSAF